MNEGRYTVAVSLDISNAFNSLPWPVINVSLAERGIPRYLRRIIASYLYERTILYPTLSGWKERAVSAGVPQDSVLGPLLWNLVFDRVPKIKKYENCEVLCYADDTLILACADDPWDAVVLASLQTRLVLREIEKLGLRVATHKTDVVIFHRPRDPLPCGIAVQMDGYRVSPSPSIRYLGVWLDEHLQYKAHLERIEARKDRGGRSPPIPKLSPDLCPICGAPVRRKGNCLPALSRQLFYTPLRFGRRRSGDLVIFARGFSTCRGRTP